MSEFGYTLLAALGSAAAVTLYATKRATDDLRNEVKKVPSSERLEFLENQARNMRKIDTTAEKVNFAIFGNINTVVLSKISRECLDPEEYLYFSERLFKGEY